FFFGLGACFSASSLISRAQSAIEPDSGAPSNCACCPSSNPGWFNGSAASRSSVNGLLRDRAPKPSFFALAAGFFSGDLAMPGIWAESPGLERGSADCGLRSTSDPDRRMSAAPSGNAKGGASDRAALQNWIGLLCSRQVHGLRALAH